MRGDSASGGGLLVPEQRHFARARLAVDHGQCIASHRHSSDPQHFHRERRRCLLDLSTLVIQHRANAARMDPDHQNVADFQRAARDEYSGERTLALVKLGLDHGRFRRAFGIGFEFQQFRLQQNFFDQIVQPSPSLGRDFHVLHIARHRLDDDFMLKQTLADFLRVELRLVALGDCNNHRHAGRLGVIDRLDCLRHQPIVTRHHQNDDVGHVRTAHPHVGEGFVTRCIQERDQLAALGLDLISADVLGNPASLAFHHIGTAQRIQQAGFAVIDMAHDRHHRWTRFQGIFGIDIGCNIDINVAVADTQNRVAEFFDQQFRRVLINHVAHGGWHAHLEQRFDQIRALFGHPIGQFLHGDRIRHGNLARLLFTRLALAGKVGPAFLLACALQRGERARARAFVFIQCTADG